MRERLSRLVLRIWPELSALPDEQLNWSLRDFVGIIYGLPLALLGLVIGTFSLRYVRRALN